MKIRRIQTAAQGNMLWPLPPDYAELNGDGPRLARLNACLQFRLPWGPQDRTRESITRRKDAEARVFADCVRFFDSYYLKPDGEFQPWFYDVEPCDDAPFHYWLQYYYWRYRANIIIAPRGAAKTVSIRKRITFLPLVTPGFSLYYTTSNYQNTMKSAEVLKAQFKLNQRIQDDFSGSHLFPDGIAPKRGDGHFSTEFMQLKNGAMIEMRSAKSGQRGGRPLAYELDDPENDAEDSTDMQLRREFLSRTIFKVVMPMLQRPGTRLCWTGTFVSRQHYAWSAMQDKFDESGETKPADPRFTKWNRMIIKLANEKKQEDGTTKLVSCWPGMWPSDEEERERLNLSHDNQTISQIRADVGESIFQSEYMANPGSADDPYFLTFDPHQLKGPHAYWYEQPDADLINQPRRSKTLICWRHYDGVDYHVEKVPLAEFLKEATVFATLDTSFTATVHSDYKVCHVIALNSYGEAFSLDLWADQTDQDTLCRTAFVMADRWGALALYPEYVASQRDLYISLKKMAQDQLTAHLGVSHVPAVMPLKVGTQSKGSKVSNLRVWFDFNLIKLPLISERPEYKALVEQIVQVNPQDEQELGLEKDDHLDTLAMMCLVSKLRPENIRTPSDLDDRTELEKVLDGDLYLGETGIPRASAIDFRKLTIEQLMQLGEQAATQQAGGTANAI